jgi:acetoin utilization deacetylase AcuC-like enzyme
MPYPGPVFDFASALSYLEASGKKDLVTREDLERIHSADFIAALFGDGPKPQDRAESAPQSRTAKAPELSGLEKALLQTYELIDSQGRPCRYEPERAIKPLTALFQIILAQVSGTYLACRLALAPGAGFCFYLGGGMHHARYDRGSGFCLVNDIAVAIRKIQAEGRSRLVWVIDLDAHKGDGTAELVRFARERGELAPRPAENPGAEADKAAPAGKPRIGAPYAGTAHSDPPRSGTASSDPPRSGEPGILTLSVHMAHGWPLDGESLAQAEKGRAPLVSSDIDIGVDRGEEARYVPRLAEGIAELEAMSGNEKPDLVLVVDGADPYEHDGLPSSALLKLSLEQCLERDNFVYRYVIDRNIPSAWIQAGGYGERAWEPSAHFLRGIR